MLNVKIRRPKREDSNGYTSAQKVWKKKFGEPDYLLKDYWDPGNDHMIWRITVSDCITE